jgi:putative DNA primase/helicase
VTNPLLPQHQALLDGSAIAQDVAAARGYRSITDPADLEALGYSPDWAPRFVPCLAIPIRGMNGAPVAWHIRPDNPRTDEKGRPHKYEFPPGGKNRLDIPPAVREKLADPKVALFVTEGARKVDAAVSRGLPCIGIIGTWSWRGTNALGGKTALAEWHDVALNDGRPVVLAFDSDFARKREVYDAVKALKDYLEKKGAHVWIAHLDDGPAGPDGEPAKMGLDDFFAAGGTVDDLRARTDRALGRRPRAKMATGGNGEEKIPTDAAAVAKWILLQGDRFARDGGGRLFCFTRGSYSPRGERRVQAAVKHYFTSHHIASAWSNHKARETTEYLLADAQELWEAPPIGKLNVRNGLLDLASGTLDDHAPGHLSPVQLPIFFDPVATCPVWEKFIAAVFPKDAADLAWQLLAWLMIPFTGIQKAVLLMGEGGTGKSTFLTAVKVFLGRSNVSAMPLHRLESDRFAVGGLVGKLANICADLPSRDLAGTSVFKAITGGDELTAEHKFKDSFSVLPFARLIFSANRPPKSPDATEAFFERWIVVPFDRKFRGQEGEIPRHQLDAQLAAPGELSGALNRAIEALPAVLDRGITIAPSMLAAHAAFRETTDPIQVWLNVNTLTSPALMVGKKTLKEAYNRHAVAKGLSTESDTSFALAVRAWKPDLLDAQRPWQGRPQIHCWLGIGLQANPHGSHPSQPSHPFSSCSNARPPGENEGGEEKEDRNNKCVGGVNVVKGVNQAMAEADVYRASRPPLPPKAGAGDAGPGPPLREPGDGTEEGSG